MKHSRVCITLYNTIDSSETESNDFILNIVDFDAGHDV